MSYCASLHHIVFGTYCRRRTIRQEQKEEIFRYIWGIIKNKKCKLLRINAMSDHVHMLVDLHSTVSLSDLVGTIKQSTSIWIKKSGGHPLFEGWAKEYYASSVSPEARNAVIHYIQTQESHHATRSFSDELRLLVESSGLEWYETREEVEKKDESGVK